MHCPDIPFSFIASQTCRNCQMPVTCGPVYVVHDLNILCGRCRMIAEDRYRNYSYEALASIFMYPCQNWRNHCSTKLKWNECLDHEPQCDYVGCCTFLFSHPAAFFKGPREMPKDEVRLVLIPEELLEYIKCTICEGYLNCSPVYIQANGQNICHRCVHANGTPPYSRPNKAYEDLCQMFIFPCIYRNRGCSERMPFGTSLWRHESQCDYGIQIKPKYSPISHSPTDEKRTSVKKKEKGLIKTQTGVIWATLTPNTIAPNQLLKSLAIKQEKHRRRVDEIGNDMVRRNSETESDSTYDRGNSGHTTPDMLQNETKPYISPDDYNNRPSSVDSFRNPYISSEDYDRGYQYEYRDSGNRIGNNYNRGFQDDQEYHRRSSNRPRESFRETPVAGNFPVLTPRHLNDGFGSISQRYSQRDSFQGNTLLINELKLKQDMIKRTHSIKGDQDMTKPSFKNNNLNDIEEIRR